MNHDVFISYSSKNSTAAQAICHELEDKGIKCWMAPRDIPVGAKYASVITKAIVGCRIVVLVFSDDSARSPWVESEINIAFSNRKTIIPYKIDKTNYEEFDEFYLMLNNRHWIEAYPDYKTRFKELVTIVAQTLGRDISTLKPAKAIPTLAPISAPISMKKYWWVSFCVLVLGVMVWNFLPEENGEEFYAEGVIDIKKNKRAKCSEAPEMQELMDSIPASDTALEELRIEKEYEALEQNNAELQSNNEELKNSNSDLQKNINDIKAKGSQQSKATAKQIQSAKVALKQTENKTISNNQDTIIYSFWEDLARVKSNDKYGYIDKTGKEVIPLKYDDADSFQEGLAQVKLNGKCGYIDKTGKEVIPLKYDVVDYFREGLARVKLNGKYGYVDKTGKEVISLKYDYALPFREGLAYVVMGGKARNFDWNGGKWGFIDKTGKEIIPLKYDDLCYFSEDLALVKLNGKYGYIDKTDKVIISLKYDWADSFHEGLAYVRINGKYGYIDKTGKEVIPLKYDRAYSFNNGKAEVELNGEEFYIDKNGNRIEE